MIYLIAALFCAALYSIKGGWHGRARRFISRLAGTKFDEKNEPADMSIPQAILWSLMDGKILSTAGFGAVAFMAGYGFLAPAAGWLLGVAPTIKEEISAVGGIKGNWRPEKNRLWGWKKGFMRGVYFGACLAVPFGNTVFIWTCALFPLCSYIGVSIEQLRTGRIMASWHWYEPIMGAAVGLALASLIN